MKAINNYINESRQIHYRVSFNDVNDSEDLPLNASIIIEAKDKLAFEKFLIDEQDNIFMHADGGDVEY